MAGENEPKEPLHSSIMTQGLYRATHRSLFYSMGWHPEHLEKPLVAVVNSFNELMPGHIHLNQLVLAIKLGIAEYGGTPSRISLYRRLRRHRNRPQRHEDAHAEPGVDCGLHRADGHGPCL